MSAALFPELAPAPPPSLVATPVPFSSYPETSRVENDDPGRTRRRVLVPRGRPRPSAMDPDEDRARRQADTRLRRDVVDALSALLAQPYGSYPEWLEDALGRVVAKGGRRMQHGELVRRPDRTARDWLFDLLGDMNACEEVLAFREAQCGAFDVRPQSCRSRVCPPCARRRAAQLVRVFSALVGEVPARRRSYFVPTIRNVPFGQLAEGFDRLGAAARSLRGRPLWRGGRCRARQRDGTPRHPCAGPYCSRWSTGRHRRDRNCPDFRHEPVHGGVIAYETTVNLEQRTWHPHANMVIDAPRIPQDELSVTWRALTCSDKRHRRAGWCPPDCDLGSPIVWIKQVDPQTVREAIKYVTKGTELISGEDPVQLLEFLLATRGRRMVQGFGSFFGVQLEDEEDPEPTVTLEVEVPGVFRAGQQVVRRYRLPRRCRQCGHDTLLPSGDVTYEPPVRALYVDVRLRNGFPSWRPPPAAVPRC